MSVARMKIVPADFDRHAAHILALLNDAVLHTTWVYDCDPHPESFMREYFDGHAAGNYPVLAAESEDGGNDLHLCAVLHHFPVRAGRTPSWRQTNARRSSSSPLSQKTGQMPFSRDRRTMERK